MNTLNLILILAVAGLVVWVWKLRKENSELKIAMMENLFEGDDNDCPVEVSEAQEAKEEKKRQIVEYLKTNGKASNNDIENLIGISDSTATRYLQELEDEGLVLQEGQTGHAVFYSLK
ncbi:MAG: hypothetical protein UY41_C0034G0002 [Candidatus Moranbacteria bacterium GW2011_GWE1_49_15]|nr:MAG: hypothetical protein UX75_C0041G0013 [Candidatus Moranbacteria bacterium GW2011_GWE2_47_10]KKW06098.1 MAG: hypothetical protein UY41_C0034G0002 [Candidatus Moranbacteria bacterium GW2011_GWE1_49_15]HBP01014.1 hypothetical protein [Candidatus Moranbacteria bacterium]